MNFNVLSEEYIQMKLMKQKFSRKNIPYLLGIEKNTEYFSPFQIVDHLGIGQILRLA